mmetsp:Transcript_39375/g.92088  ORF Transcript_39375/g.92088 Transcript_39375/m.92088 type:complete len:136 (-) Transcript_39375:211-618(-)|eukprot:CAMPEP_0119351812 /NCGR_PEP_ID=MMETSP1334-20130426/1121_1 /TAXON_ID=127549 /ORGANISM="Calcidiscus leptoporus, Strain RCC1130" /LENGTH=135 /DNA_ID=CAMNT_0007364693 /DNA_START=36 /DNA_END=443 /DNA_ORIENTATION=-
MSKAAPGKPYGTHGTAWEHQMNNFVEIPIGRSGKPLRAASKIWVDVAVSPLFAVIGAASLVCGSYLVKYFSGNSDVRWSKSLRGGHDVGANEKRVDIHNRRYGMQSLNKKPVNIFPFNYKPLAQTIDEHRFDKQP